MDSFDKNIKDLMSAGGGDLPEDLGWENMRDGIYGRMEKPKPRHPWKWLSLALLLIVGGCGTWLALDYLDVQKEAEIVNRNANQSQAKEEAKPFKTHSTITTENKKNSSEPNSTVEGKPTSATEKNDFITTSKAPSTEYTTSIEKQLPNSLSIATEMKSPEIQGTTPSNGFKNIPIVLANGSTTSPVSSSMAKEAKALSLLSSKDALLSTVERDKPSLNLNQNLPQVQRKKSISPFSISLSTGIIFASPILGTEGNRPYVKEFPGYTINADLQWHFHKKRSIILGYEYARLEELFDFEETDRTRVEKPQALVGEVRNSLLGLVVNQEFQDTSTTAERYRKEVHYNKYWTHSVQLSYTESVSFGKRSKFEFAFGGQWLFNLKEDAKGIINGEIEPFEDDTLLKSKQNFGLRIAAKYQYSIGNRTSLFARLSTVSYLSRWYTIPNYERDQSTPMNIGGNLGINYRL